MSLLKRTQATRVKPEEGNEGKNQRTGLFIWLSALMVGKSHYLLRAAALFCLAAALELSSASASQTPIGSLETIDASGNASGWVIDPDSSAQPIFVRSGI